MPTCTCGASCLLSDETASTAARVRPKSATDEKLSPGSRSWLMFEVVWAPFAMITSPMRTRGEMAPQVPTRMIRCTPNSENSSVA